MHYVKRSIACTIHTRTLNRGKSIWTTLHRLTFSGCVFLPPIFEGDSYTYGFVILLVDGVPVAKAFLNPIISDTAGYYMVSIDTIRQLEPGQIVSVVWDPSNTPTDITSLWSSAEGAVTHFTGQLLGSPTMQ